MDRLKSFLIYLFFALVMLAFLPLVLLCFPFEFITTRKSRKKFIEQELRYQQFLVINEGRCFFCYNNRQNAKNYIENKILPVLSDGIEPLYLDGKALQAIDDENEFLSMALFRLQNYQKFPHLLTIRDGKLIDQSINNLFYNVMNGTQTKEELFARIDAFFGMKYVEGKNDPTS